MRLVHRLLTAAAALALAATPFSPPAAASAYACTVSVAIDRGVATGEPFVQGEVRWGPDCREDVVYKLQLWVQTGPTDRNKEYGCSLANIRTSNGAYVHCAGLKQGRWACGGIGLWRARAEIGGVVGYSAKVHCPDRP